VGRAECGIDSFALAGSEDPGFYSRRERQVECSIYNPIQGIAAHICMG